MGSKCQGWKPYEELGWPRLPSKNSNSELVVVGREESRQRDALPNSKVETHSPLWKSELALSHFPLLFKLWLLCLKFIRLWCFIRLAKLKSPNVWCPYNSINLLSAHYNVMIFHLPEIILCLAHSLTYAIEDISILCLSSSIFLPLTNLLLSS